MANDQMVPMTLGETLKQYLGGERKQSAVAAMWREAMIARGHEWSQAHVESQVSRCRSDQVAAIKFFFGDRVRGLAFVEALGVPASKQEAILQLAEEALTRNGERPAKLFLDLVPWSGRIETKKLFEAVRTSIVEPKPLKPCVLLVTREQYDELPRSFDHEKEWLEARCVDADGAAGVIDANALVASPTAHEPERWAAIGFDSSGVLIFEPADALAQFARSGKLAQPAVEHDLQRFVSTEELPAARVPKDPLERRRWATLLRTEDRAVDIDPDPRVRLSTARSLGVAAVATPRDRIEHELAVAMRSLPLSATIATKEQLQSLLSRAARFPHPEALVRVGDELHLINPSESLETIAPKIVVHRIKAKQTALRRLETHLHEWDDAHRDDDSFLWKAIEQLGDDADDRLALLHARTTIVRTSSPRAEAARDPISARDALDALIRVVASEPPAARLRLQNRGQVLRASLPEWTTSSVARCDEADANVLLFTQAPFATIVVDRERSALGFVRDQRDVDYGYGPRRTHFVGGKEMPDERVWIERFESFLAKRFLSPGAPPVEVTPYDLSEHVWAAADDQLALMWTFLRQIRHRSFVQRHDGKAIVRVSPGLGIQLTGTRMSTTRASATAIIDTTEREQSFGGGIIHSVSHDISLGITGYNNITASVPLPITLYSGDVRLSVGVIASPLFGFVAGLGSLGDGKSDDYSDDD
ncbi:MAG: hypothetical protein AB7T06_10795 [Kofleriaceae bacterium]